MKKKYLGAPTPPEDEAISLFAGLLANPDMVLSRYNILKINIVITPVVVSPQHCPHIVTECLI